MLPLTTRPPFTPTLRREIHRNAAATNAAGGVASATGSAAVVVILTVLRPSAMRLVFRPVPRLAVPARACVLNQETGFRNQPVWFLTDWKCFYRGFLVSETTKTGF